ncbi:MAG TPA: hypothetical protein VHE78_06370 [Gemmatimonadaceae bacterium]|nr:hypothetical protein [Gemmatimonadaceae bacterium]
MSLHQVLTAIHDLEMAGVVERYAIGGAVGATRYLAAVSTEDVDVFVTFKGASGATLNPLAPIYGYLKPRGAKVSEGHLVIGGWPVQFLPAAGPLLEDAIAAAVHLDVDGVPTRVFTAEHLTAIALQVGRAKDKLRVVQMVEAKVLDMPRFEAILELHGLKTRWKDFSRALLGG